MGGDQTRCAGRGLSFSTVQALTEFLRATAIVRNVIRRARTGQPALVFEINDLEVFGRARAEGRDTSATIGF
jgi:hypothetical protein